MSEALYDPFDSNKEKRIPIVSIGKMETILLRKMAERFKEINPGVAARIDAEAARIMGLPFAKKVISDNDPSLGSKNARPAIYIESDAGQGKTTIVRSAFMKFCDIAGMNFVENPPEHYMPTKNDAYFFTANMISQNNTSEVGGLPVKINLGAGRDEPSLVNEFVSRVDQIARMTKDQTKVHRFEHGGLDAATIEVDFKKPAVAISVVNTMQDWLMETLEGSGGRLSIVGENGAVDESRFSVKAEIKDSKLRLTYYEPKAQIREMAAMGKLPNIAWAKAAQAGCCMMFVDEVDKITPGVRHLLLEIAQFGRVSGTANLGDHYMVVMAGNLGDRGDFNDFNESISQATVAETTRQLRYRVVVTPEEWAKYIESVYPGSDNAHFPSFIRMFGDQPGIFRPNYDGDEFDPHMPCSNARSLENAMKEAKKLFMLADEAGVSRGEVMGMVEEVTLAAMGSTSSFAYASHVEAMESMAVPIANHIIRAKDEQFESFMEKKVELPGGQKVDLMEILNEKTGGFSFISPESVMFAQRFQMAMVNESVRGFIDAKDEKEQILAAAKGIAGLGVLRPEMVNAGVSNMMGRIKALNGEDHEGFLRVVSKAIERGAYSGSYGDAAKSEKENAKIIKEAIDDMIYAVTGSRPQHKAAAKNAM